MSITIFVFRRDLRINDNIALDYAISLGKPILPVFILDMNLLKKEKYFANKFLFESLNDLQSQFNKKGSSLLILHGKPFEIMKNLTENHNVENIVVSKDYTPYSQKREYELKKLCELKSINFVEIENLLLNPVEKIKTNLGRPYKVFTPYFISAIKFPIKEPSTSTIDSDFIFSDHKLASISIEDLCQEYASKSNNDLIGGREHGLFLLENIQNFENYKKLRDFPKIKTSRLSPYLKYGCLSPREVYHKLISKFGKGHEMIRQLYWREFYIYIGFYFTKVFKQSFNEKMEEIPWDENYEAFEMWKSGETGFPIVDAGMRELKQTGFMHNRVRMIVASFLTKDLFIPWWWGEKYFSEKLIDHDVSVNNGSWQWSASTGIDAVPYFRIFNPWRQQERYDPDCSYIKQWIPELHSLPAKQIHNWEKHQIEGINYPKPMLDHKRKSRLVIEIFKEILLVSEI